MMRELLEKAEDCLPMKRICSADAEHGQILSPILPAATNAERKSEQSDSVEVRCQRWMHGCSSMRDLRDEGRSGQGQ